MQRATSISERMCISTVLKVYSSISSCSDDLRLVQKKMCLKFLQLRNGSRVVTAGEIEGYWEGAKEIYSGFALLNYVFLSVFMFSSLWPRTPINTGSPKTEMPPYGSTVLQSSIWQKRARRHQDVNCRTSLIGARKQWSNRYERYCGLLRCVQKKYIK